MYLFVALASLGLILIVLWDGFETIVLPRRVTRRLQLAALFRQVTWGLWSARCRRARCSAGSENYLALYGPLSQLALLILWVVGLVLGFAGLHWALGSRLSAGGQPVGFATDVYYSGTTFLTLGLGDVLPQSTAERGLTIVEVGTGFALLALVISYLPVLYQAFSRREVSISLLDARAGSPPTAMALIERCGNDNGCDAAAQFLRDWERWSADLLETHLSYPVLGYFRSQHENQSWVAALTAVLDVAALVSAGLDGIPTRQGRLTFAMARHAVVDLAGVFNTPPQPPAVDRLDGPLKARMRQTLAEAGLPFHDAAAEEHLSKLRGLYEPYVQALADHFLMPLPGWFPSDEAVDNWQSTAWGRSGRASDL